MQNLSLTQKYVLLLGFAIFLRLLLMPFFMHMDLLSELRRVHFALEHEVYYPGFNRLTIFYIEKFFLFFTQWFFVDTDILLYLQDPAYSTASETLHFIFVGDPHVYRHVFLFKLPYLVFDLLCAWLVFRFFSGHKSQFFFVAFWLFNPVTIYATYLFGRFEVIFLFFLMATALALKERRLLFAVILFSLAFHSREICLVFVPPFILVMIMEYRAGRVNGAQFLGFLGFTLVLLIAPYLMKHLFNLESAFTRESNVLEVKKGVSGFFNLEYGGIYIYFLIAALGFFSLLNKKHLSAAAIFIFSGLTMIVPFFFGDFKSAHYFTWVLPFLVLAGFYAENIKFPLVVMLVFWVLFWLLNPYGANFTLLLATPVHEAFFGFSTFKQYWNNLVGAHPVLNVIVLKKIFMTMVSAAMLYVLIRIYGQPEVKEAGNAV